MRRLSVVLVALGLISSAPAVSAAEHRPDVFPTSISLPDGLQPEGIAIGPGPVAFFGSLADGCIYRADLRTGKGVVINTGGPGKQSVGLKTDRRGRLFVSGGDDGDAWVIDTRTGGVLASYQLTTGTTFINDVVLAQGAAWFTDSMQPNLYKLSLRRGLPDAATTIPLTGDLEFQEGFNTNGIAATPDGRGLLVVQSNTGLLFRVNPATGVTRQVDLGGELLTNGDGLLLLGRTLYVVRNTLNTVSVVRLNAAGTTGRVVREITDSRFDVPTTAAAFGNRLYLPNARFTTPPTPTTPYNAVAVRRS